MPGGEVSVVADVSPSRRGSSGQSAGGCDRGECRGSYTTTRTATRKCPELAQLVSLSKTNVRVTTRFAGRTTKACSNAFALFVVHPRFATWTVQCLFAASRTRHVEHHQSNGVVECWERRALKKLWRDSNRSKNRLGNSTLCPRCVAVLPLPSAVWPGGFVDLGAVSATPITRVVVEWRPRGASVEVLSVEKAPSASLPKRTENEILFERMGSTDLGECCRGPGRPPRGLARATGKDRRRRGGRGQ